MSFVLKLLGFALFSGAYWFVLLYILGGLTYASICHYPDVPGCRSDLLPVAGMCVLGFGLYLVLFRLFARWTRSDRTGYGA
jgi:hypothetical protein